MRSSSVTCRQLLSIFAVGLAILVSVAEPADARRASGGFGGFGSRGARTYQAPPTTAVAPTPAAPIQRSMTQPSQVNPAGPLQSQGGGRLLCAPPPFR